MNVIDTRLTKDKSKLQSESVDQNAKSSDEGSVADTRLTKASSGSHTSREENDRDITADREFSDQERLDEFRRTLYQSSLPNLPEIPGYHVCWLTTTNPSDSVHARIRLGYEPILAHELPGWDHTAEKAGEFAGCVSVNEMLAFKLPMRLYQMYMKHAHHDEPLEQEGKLRTVIDVIKNQADRMGAGVEEEEGTAELGKSRRAPVFS